MQLFFILDASSLQMNDMLSGMQMDNNNNKFIYIAPLKTMFTQSQSKTSGIAFKSIY